MEQKQQNPVFGRKIFFLNPPYAIRSTVIEKLRTQEYETYYIEDYHFAKPVLRKNQDSILFIDIDEGGLSVQEWFNFVKTFEDEDILKTIYIGILSQKIKISEKNQFLLKTNIPGGFIMLTEGLDIIIDKIIKICEINGAKGRRQYVRLDCKNLSDTSVNVSKDGRLYTMKLVDISSVGFACSISAKDKLKFQEKEVLKSIIISVGSKTINCEAAIFAIKDNGDFATIVMLLLQTTPIQTKNIIRNYVFSSLQNSIQSLIDGSIGDLTDYSVEIKSSDSNNSKFISDITFDSIDALGDISDLEELPEL